MTDEKMKCDVSNHDVLRAKEAVEETSHHVHGYTVFFSCIGGQGNYPVGSIFLSIRRKKIVKSEFAGRSFTKTFEEIVLSPDGRVGILEKIKSLKIA